jgi:hypothetical protein
LGALFRETQVGLIEKTLCERIAMVFIKIVADLLELFDLDVNVTISRIIASNDADKNTIIILNAITLLSTENHHELNLA